MTTPTESSFDEYDDGDAAFSERTPDPSFPWPPAKGESILRAFSDTWTGAALRPGDFFRRMPEHGTVRTALLYYVPLGILVAGATLFWALVAGPTDADREVVLGEVPLAGPMNPLVEFLLSPLLLLASLFIAAGVVHLLLRMFGGANRSFGFTTRVFAYAYSPQALGIIPVVGTVVGFIWMVGVAIIGLRAGHGTSTGRAAAAVLIPVVIALFFLAIAAIVAVTGDLIVH